MLERSGCAAVVVSQPHTPQYRHIVSKQSRPDGLSYHEWQVLDERDWALASGTSFGGEAKAAEKAQKGNACTFARLYLLWANATDRTATVA